MHDPATPVRDEARQCFDALLQARMAQPFAWGRQDCCLFAADAVQALTGRDLAADVRGTYSTAEAALAVLAAVGGLEAAGARAGAPILPLAAAVGDVGLVPTEGRESLAVCVGALWLAPARTGLAALPLAAARLAWRTSRA